MIYHNGVDLSLSLIFEMCFETNFTYEKQTYFLPHKKYSWSCGYLR